MKKIGLVLLGLLVIGMASAALVNYLSNTATVDIEVASPMETGISLGEDGNGYWGGAHFPTLDWNYEWETELPTLNIFGGETLTLYIMSANMADVEIEGFEEAIVTNDAGVTCEDFESIIVRVDSIYGDLGYGTPQDVINLGACFVIDANSVKIGSTGNSLWGVGETDVSEIVVTFKTNAEGTYTFTYQVIPAVD